MTGYLLAVKVGLGAGAFNPAAAVGAGEGEGFNVAAVGRGCAHDTATRHTIVISAMLRIMSPPASVDIPLALPCPVLSTHTLIGNCTPSHACRGRRSIGTAPGLQRELSFAPPVYLAYVYE